jgi:prolipoprotein diacylglyceryltransferase
LIDFLAYITWDVNPNIIESPIMVRYYGLLWASSFFVGLWLMKKMMANDKAPDAYTDKIFIYVMLGAVLGARLGHCIFYQPDYYFTAEHWMEIPKIWEGGLASHGGLIGVVLALWLYSKRITKRNILWAGDKVVVTVAIAACLIRVGNLMNSEIIGTQSDSNAALFFEYDAKYRISDNIETMSSNKVKVEEIDVVETGKDGEGPIGKLIVKVSSQQEIPQDYLNSISSNVKQSLINGFNPKEDHISFYNNHNEVVIANGSTGMFEFGVRIIPRIPTQIWEAFAYLIIFGVMMFGYWKKHWYKKEGLLFGLFLVLLFGARFIIEFWKEHQTLPDDAVLNMGQWLSIIPVVIGILIMLRAVRLPEVNTEISEFEAKK